MKRLRPKSREIAHRDQAKTNLVPLEAIAAEYRCVCDCKRNQRTRNCVESRDVCHEDSKSCAQLHRQRVNYLHYSVTVCPECLWLLASSFSDITIEMWCWARAVVVVLWGGSAGWERLGWHLCQVCRHLPILRAPLSAEEWATLAKYTNSVLTNANTSSPG